MPPPLSPPPPRPPEKSKKHRADELCREALSLRETVKHVEEGLEEAERLTTVANGRLDVAKGETRALRQEMREARDQALDKARYEGEIKRR